MRSLRYDDSVPGRCSNPRPGALRGSRPAPRRRLGNAPRFVPAMVRLGLAITLTFLPGLTHEIDRKAWSEWSHTASIRSRASTRQRRRSWTNPSSGARAGPGPIRRPQRTARAKWESAPSTAVNRTTLPRRPRGVRTATAWDTTLTATGTNDPSTPAWGDDLSCVAHHATASHWIASGYASQGGAARQPRRRRGAASAQSIGSGACLTAPGPACPPAGRGRRMISSSSRIGAVVKIIIL